MSRPDPRALKDEAAEAAARGKWKKALECYYALERLERHEGLWPQKAGDACRKLGRTDDAIASYTRAADLYSRQGFLLKAVACCKLILELAPTHTATQERLAALHAARLGATPPLGGTPTGPTALADLPLGRMVPGARPSREIAAATAAEEAVFEIPLDDEAADRGSDVAADAGADALEAVRRAFERTPLFSSLDAGRLRRLIERARLVRLTAGETLFRKGDPGDALFVVAAGEVIILAEGEVELARLSDGAFFGEIALLADQPRSATVRAARETDVLAIDRSAIAELVAGSPETLKVFLRFLRDRLVATLLDTSPLFAGFPPEERRRLVARFRFLEVDRGVAVVEEGRPAPGLFCILAGTAEVTLQGAPAPLATLGPADVFGEISLLSRGPAVATIRTTTRAFLLELPRADFHEIIMTHPQVLEYVHSLADDRQKRLDAHRLQVI